MRLLLLPLGLGSEGEEARVEDEGRLEEGRAEVGDSVSHTLR